MPSGLIIIADSGPLIGLARISRLELLRNLSARVLIPRSVWKEITEGKADAPGASEILEQHWIEIVSGNPAWLDKFMMLVDMGEAEALAIAQEMPSATLLIDDLKARKVAASLGLKRMGTLALLAQAKRLGFLDRVRPEIQALREHGIFLGENLVEAVLKEVGE